MIPRAGDIIFLASTSWSSRFIRWVTGGMFSHVAVYISNELILESDWLGVQMSRFAKYKNENVEYKIVKLPDGIDRRKFLKALLKRVGDGYDYSFLIGNGLYRLFNWLKPYIGNTYSTHRYICIVYVTES